MSLKVPKVKSDSKSDPQHYHSNNRADSSLQRPQRQCLREARLSIPNNRGHTARTGLPPRPSAASTLQWQRTLFQVFGYSHHGRDEPAAGSEQQRPRETVDPPVSAET
ncbi:hypothetical protein N7517_004699 [Penicillium concentricum]|uniref:Uncharacterized protein n=1 Tax=Penicillium concentricum TaxID=293559 RepID=A0A9W9S603_9EURO|nr:uncharacterized protein N7517_004699 [Penicillium concentricum]KAJ5372693.1 hypothetical protein N7517_004699 [Penicillium concentricum]